MIHEGERLRKAAKQREEESERELDPKRREQLKRLAAELRAKERAWYKPR